MKNIFLINILRMFRYSCRTAKCNFVMLRWLVVLFVPELQLPSKSKLRFSTMKFFQTVGVFLFHIYNELHSLVEAEREVQKTDFGRFHY